MDAPAIELSVGDDGLYMTKRRVSMHRSLNFLLVWGLISLVSTLAFSIAAYLQGQTFASWELIADGGAMYNGFQTATLLRAEAGYCFASGILLIIMHFTGFIWFYERRRKRILVVVSAIIGTAALCWLSFLASIGIFGPLTFASLVSIALFWILAYRVEAERHTVDLTV